MWSCPLCRQDLHFNGQEKAWSCANKHLFDRAREGYVNLLPANKKHSRAPGDSAEMIGARRRIHTAELYRPLAEAVQVQMAVLGPISRILDIGCGEGYYSHALQQAQRKAQVCGVDISKPAIRCAAKKYRGINFAVASAYQLPVPSLSQDLLVRIFAPSNDDEIIRVLSGEGAYLEVTPAPDHLWALREALYDTPRANENTHREILGLQLQHSVSVEYEVQLNRELLRDLVAMTPFAHRGHREKRERLLARESQIMQMAFSLRLFRKA